MHVPFCDLEARFTVERGFRMPFHRGGLLHGLLGRSLRRVACAERSGGVECKGACAAPARCLWTRLFSPVAPDVAPHPLLASVHEPPSPLVLRLPPPGAEVLAEGASLSVTVRLLGARREEEVSLVERALMGFADLPFGQDQGRVACAGVARGEVRSLEVGLGEMGLGQAERGSVTVRFETPVRIKQGGKTLRDIDFATLFAQAWRRLTMVCSLYGGYGREDDETFRALLPKAREVNVRARDVRLLQWEHLSVETGVRKPLQGLMGHVTFEGNVGLFLPALRGAEAVHIGGWTGLGLGRVRVALPGEMG